MISVTIQQSEICTGSKRTQQDNTPSKWAQEKCNLFDTLHKRGRINWTYSVIIFLSFSGLAQESASCMTGARETKPWLLHLHKGRSILGDTQDITRVPFTRTRQVSLKTCSFSYIGHLFHLWLLSLCHSGN